MGSGRSARSLRAALAGGFLTARAYWQAKKRAASRMRARHGTLARDIQVMHAHRFQAVYGYRKVYHRLIRRGWRGIGRDQVLHVMQELGIQGVRRGRIPITTRPARSAGGRPDLVERRFTAEAPGRLHVADITIITTRVRLVRLCGVRHRRVRASDRGLGRQHEPAHHATAVDRLGLVHQPGCPTWGYARPGPPFGSRHPVHQRPVRHAPQPSRHSRQHGQRGRLV
ncbi:transposase subunit B [Bifidobacterium minimum]|uniref:Transposase subunit B n=1 Tax=Bifidobacterium minimum TaxID=1693 RepID=A0A087BSC4_9BIFI|nr:transposase subunit B [Bifidobacterium minimum]